jgi:hypothetical protein
LTDLVRGDLRDVTVTVIMEQFVQYLTQSGLMSITEQAGIGRATRT